MYYTIYQTVNLVNGKFYIGMHETEDLDDDYLGSGKALKRSIKYYGKEKFEKTVLFIFDNREDMIAKEIEMVTEEFVNRKDTYNLMLGGTGGKTLQDYSLTASFAGKKHAERLKSDPEYKKRYSEKISEANKLAWKLGRKKFTKNPFEGKKHSDETKQKMRKSKNKGYNNSQFGTCWITNEFENKKIHKGDLIPDGWRLGRIMKLGS